VNTGTKIREQGQLFELCSIYIAAKDPFLGEIIKLDLCCVTGWDGPMLTKLSATFKPKFYIIILVNHCTVQLKP
jgi:hypothetical protein